MRSVCAFGFALFLATGLFAQNRSGFVTTPGVVRSFPSVVFPGGTSALPGVQRTTGSVVFPGSGGPQIAVPAIPFQVPGRTGIVNPSGTGLGFNNGFRNGINNGFNNRFNNGFKDGNRFRNNNNNNGNVIAYPVPYPVYEGGGGYGYDQQMMPQAPAQTPPNVIVLYPQGPAYQAQQGYPAGPAAMAPPQSSIVEIPQAPEPVPTTATHYLIALKDHSIYSAVAYFVEGDTLHYFTTGNSHSQVKISLVDRDLTHRLNEDSGLEIKLPPVQ